MTDAKERSAKAPSGDYEVGYCRPPIHTRFKPGQSGNPKGRPKGTKNLKTDLQEELSERITVREGDQSKQVSKQRAVVKTLVAHTLKGEVRAANLLTNLMLRLLDTGEGAPEVEEALHDDEQAILSDFLSRAQRREAPEAASTPEEPS